MTFRRFDLAKPLLDWYDENARVLPWRGTRAPYAVWLSEIMLQQTRVDTVIPYYNRFLKELPSIRALAEADEDTLLKLWEGLGYYRRVRNLKKAAQAIIRDFNGAFPGTFEEILRLPGIGAYTAGAIASICFDLPRPAVDGNVLRVMTRLTGSRASIDDPGTKRDITEQLATAYHAAPSGRRGDLTQSLMELGALVCLPNGAPLCGRCPLNEWCASLQEGSLAEIPVRAKKAAKREESLTVFVLVSGTRIALLRRPDTDLLAGLWELPNAPGVLTEEQITDWCQARGLIPLSVRAGKRHTHIFTHIRWEMHPYVIECGAGARATVTAAGLDGLEGNTAANRAIANAAAFIWTTPEERQAAYALPTAFAKILRGIL